LLSSLFIGCIGTIDDDENNNDNQKTKDQINIDISNSESFRMINENKSNSKFVILDVRTSDEFSDGHIENSINIDFYSETFSEDLDKLDKNKTYMVYCRTANRSGQALDMMKDLNFSEAYNMLGGIVEWEDNGYPIVID
jgi:rhodanese-related sulfurtransferase